MSGSIQTLYEKSRKAEKIIIGLMSGTSMDGLDIALCRFTGKGVQTKAKLLHFKTAAYTETFRQQLKSVFSKSEVSLEMVCLMNEQVARTHAALVKEALKEWQMEVEQVDFLASHGQTIYHAPKSQHRRNGLPNGTLQIGDGDHLAVLTGIITLSDFRQKHIAAGGEGAPLATYGDYLLFSDKEEDRIMLNIGGISNFTYLPADMDANKVFSTDTGPGNTLMDQYVQKHFEGWHYDKDAALASKGKCNEALLSALLAHDFFKSEFPKTTGPELFNLAYLEQARQSSSTSGLSHEDVLATLCRFTAQTIANALREVKFTTKKVSIYQSGGGIHHPFLQKTLQKLLPEFQLKITSQLGIEADAKEAVLFALIANETVSDSEYHFTSNPALPSINMGKISLPR